MCKAANIVALSLYHIHVVSGIMATPSVPAWFSWRYGSHRDKRLSKISTNKGGWKDKVAALDSNQASDTEFKKCAEIAKQPPIPDQIVTNGSFGTAPGEMGLEIAIRFAKAVQHVFVLCVDCTNFKVPTEIADKISLVDGIKADECLQPWNLQNWPPRYTYLQHMVKATLAHKLIAWTALESKYSSIAVVEEDIMGWPDLKKPGALDQFYTDGEVAKLVSSHPFIRLGYIPDTWGTNCENACQRATGENSACSVHGPYLAPSSIMYIASGADTLKSFITTTGCIDITLFESLAGAVNMTFLLPPVVYHPDPIWGNQSEIIERFTSECVG